MTYYVNRNAQPNGDHEVHSSECTRLPEGPSRLYLGWFPSCAGAVRAAASYFEQVNGCFYCSSTCHTA